LSDKAVGWVRQAPGKALEWLGSIDTGGNTGYNPGLKSRLSITKDNSKNEISLTVSSVTTEDSATYYCGTVYQKTTKSCPGDCAYHLDYCGAGCYCRGGVCHVSDRYGGDAWGSWSCCSEIYTYEFYVDSWGQGLLVTVSSEGESHPR
nr:immunoglobulin mu heavy chain [Bos taurus]